MRKTIVELIVLLSLTSGPFGSQSVAQEKPDKKSFQVTLKTKMVMDLGDKKQTVDGTAETRYTWTRKGNERTLSFDLIAVEMSIDGKEAIKSLMTRAMVSNVVGGKELKATFEDAPEAVKSILRDSFEAPLCVLVVGKDGKEEKRTVVAGPGAKPFVDVGMIAAAMLFHPPFPGAQDKWESPAEISVVNGIVLDGKFTFEKESAPKDGQKFKVSAVLTKENAKLGNGQFLKKTRQVVRGQMTFDSNTKEWIAGKLLIDATIEMMPDATNVVTTTGTFESTFKILPAKK